MKALLTSMVFAMSTATTELHHLCDGILEDHDLQIPVSEIQTFGMNQNDFNDVLDRIERVYTGIIRNQGGRLRVNRKWNDSTVNASAQRSGSTYIINMYGGLARHPEITPDGFALVACHEIGHHIGGAPKRGAYFNNWASNEGQSDYFASLKCLRLLYTDDENREWVANNDIDPEVVKQCARVYQFNEQRAICMRSSMAGMSVANFFSKARNENTTPRFTSPDSNEVGRTDDSHPATQCRLDTYFAGALCDQPIENELSNQNPYQGTCNRRDSDPIGLRPLCWFKPS